MYCKECGTQIPDDSKFCKVCGAQQKMQTSYAATTPSEESKNASSPPPFKEQKKKRHPGKIALRVFGVFCILIGLVVTLVYLTGEQASKFQEDFPVILFCWGLGTLFVGISFRKRKLPGIVPQKQANGGATLVSILGVLIIVGAIGSSVASQPKMNKATNSTSKSSQSEVSQTADSILEFDKKAWEDFKSLYDSHNALMNAMGNYADGNLSSVELYDACSDIEEYFRNMSYSFDYGTTKDEKTYLQAYQTAALADQMAASNLKTYLDSLKTSDLSAAKNEIQRARDAYLTIAGNRGKLLVKAGLTDDELQAKIEKDTAELEIN